MVECFAQTVGEHTYAGWCLLSDETVMSFAIIAFLRFMYDYFDGTKTTCALHAFNV